MRDAQFIAKLTSVFEQVHVLRVGTPPEGSTDEVSWRSPDPERVSLSIIRAGKTGPWPMFFGFGRTRAVAAELRRLAAPGQWLWVSQLGMAVYLPVARKLGYRTVLDEQVAVGHARMRAAARKMRHWHRVLRATLWARHEERLCRIADRVVTRSERDAVRLRHAVPGIKPAVLPMSVHCRDYAPLRDRQGNALFFAGTLSHPSNIEGLQWFAAEVMPRLRAAMGAQLPPVIVAGANPPPRLVSRLTQAGIEVHADASSSMPGLERASIVFVPLRSGDSARVVVLEALAAGRPVVSTGSGVEGFALDPGSEVFVAQTADAFTASIVRLLRDPELRARAARHAAAAAERQFDEPAAQERLAALFND